MLEVDAQIAQNNAGAGGGGEASAAPEIRFIARNIELLSDVAARSAQGIVVHLYEASPIPDIEKQVATAQTGKGKIVLQLALDDGEEAEVELPKTYLLTDSLKNALRQIGDGLEVGEY